MDVVSTLKDLGFSEKEALVYTDLLQLGPSPVLEIARKTGLKRPTIYLIIDELIKKGAVTTMPGEKKKVFIALSPEKIAEDITRKTTRFQQALPELMALWRSESSKPAVQFFESHEGMMNVYREVAASRDIKEVLTFFSFEVIPKEFEENYDLFLKLFEKRGIGGRELISAGSPRQEYLEHVKRLPNYVARLAPKEHKFFSDTIIYGNKIAIFSFKKYFTLIIESDDVTGSFRSLFELAWRSAERLP
jgi:sugar-specific transcriptional regulator TrmB